MLTARTCTLSHTDGTAQEEVQEQLPWYVSVFRAMFGSEGGDKQQAAAGGSGGGGKSTKFTKLSMFKFRRELGM